ncbi:MAG: hypothetical protein VYC34_08635 [Planctomycetota bacterium]|nr:hypothetical protein [Planctomycetota bacterium]
MVPADATIIISTPDFEQMNSDFAGLLALMGLPEAYTPRQALAGAGLGDGMNMNGSAAIVLMGSDFETDQPPAVAIIPTSDYNALLAGFNVAKGADGVDTFNWNGEQTYARRLGDYTAIGPMREYVEAIPAKGGNMKAHAAAMGAVCQQVADDADLFVLVRVEPLRPMLQEVADPNRMQGMGAQLDVDEQVDTLVNEIEFAAFALRAETLGAGFDSAFRFKEGGEIAQALNGKADASALLKALPKRSFLFASAMDLSHPAIGKIMKELEPLMQQFQQMGGGGMPGMMGAGQTELFKSLTGYATVLYPNPAGPMAGLLANSVTYMRTDNPGKVVEMTRNAMGGMGEQQQMFSASWTENEVQIDGVNVHGYALQFNMQGNDPMAMQMMQASAMMFGPGGMQGFVAATNNGVYQTMSKNRALMTEALQAGKGAASLASDDMIKEIEQRLPSNRIAEGYLGIGAVMEQVTPFLAMFMPGMNFNVPPNLPPIGGGMSADQGAVRMGAFVPAPVLRLGANVAAKVREMQEMQGGGGGAPRF